MLFEPREIAKGIDERNVRIGHGQARDELICVSAIIQFIHDASKRIDEDRYLWTREGMRLLFDLSLAKANPEVNGENILTLATDEEVLDIATRLLEITRVALEESTCDDQGSVSQ